jgi:hypothetical protein
MYGEGVFLVDKLYFSKDAWGVTLVEEDVVVARREQLAVSADGESTMECPM